VGTENRGSKHGGKQGGLFGRRRGQGIARFFGQKAQPEAREGNGPEEGERVIINGRSDGGALQPEGRPQEEEQGVGVRGALEEAGGPEKNGDVAPFPLVMESGSGVLDRQSNGSGNADAPTSRDRDSNFAGFQPLEVQEPDLLVESNGDEGRRGVLGLGVGETESYGRSDCGADGGGTTATLPVEQAVAGAEKEVVEACVEGSGDGAQTTSNEMTASAADGDAGEEAFCPELSDVDLRQQQRLMAEFERQRRVAALVKKRNSEGGGRASAANGKKGAHKRKGPPREGEDGQKRISSFLRN
jgi:hypothetical protein